MQQDHQAAAKPLWQMDVRHRLGLEPNKTDGISRLLFAALYAARDEQEFIITVETAVSELKQALNALAK